MKQKKIILGHLYTVVYVFYVCSYILTSTAGGIFDNYYLYAEEITIFLMIALFGISIVTFEKASIYKICFLVLSVIIVMLSWYFEVISKNIVIVYLLILAYPKGLDSKKLALKLSRCAFITIAIVVLMCGIGVLPNRSFVQHNSMRYAVGFTTPNAFANFVSIFILSYLYAMTDKVKRNSNNSVKLIFLFGILIGVYLVANSRGALLFGCLGILFSAKNWEFFYTKFWKVLPTVSMIVAGFISIATTIYFSVNNLKSELIEVIFTGRLRYLEQAYITYGVKWFGNQVEFVSYNMSQLSNGMVKWFGVDNSYVYALICYGLISVIELIIMYSYLNRQIVLDRENYLIGYLVIFAIWGISENLMVNAALNFSFVLLAKYLSDPIRKNEKRRD